MRRRAAHAFALFELVLVLAIIGIMAAIAVPKFSSAVDRSQQTALSGSVSQLQRSVDLYAAEHADRGPATDPSGGTTGSGLTVVQRLIRATDDAGNVGGVYGPYLRFWPVNPYNGKKSLRIDGAAAGANTDGWRIDSVTFKIEADHGGGVAAHGALVGGGAAAIDDGGG